MRANAEPVRIARIGLVLEMEDGSKVMVYADDLPSAQVTLITETPRASMPWDMGRRFGPPVTSILIEGLESYRIQYTEPDVKVGPAGRALESFRREVRV